MSVFAKNAMNRKISSFLKYSLLFFKVFFRFGRRSNAFIFCIYERIIICTQPHNPHREIYLYMYLKCTWNCFSQYKRLIIFRLPFCMKPSDSWSKRFFHCACRHAACILFVWLPFPFTGSRTIRFHRYPAYIPRIEYAMDTAVTNARKGRVRRVTTRRGTFVSDFAMIFLVEQKMSKPLINFKRAFVVLVRTSFLPRVRSRCWRREILVCCLIRRGADAALGKKEWYIRRHVNFSV